MSSIGTGYDLSATTYSPDGRVFQVEYANKAVENSGTAIAVRVKDGVVFGVEKLIISKMLVENSNRRIHFIANHAGLALSGLIADARQIVNRARQDAFEYKSTYGEPIPIRILVERLSGFIQSHTLYSHIRPFGAAVHVAGIDRNGPQLFKINPSGESWGYFGCTSGKGNQAAKTEIEKLKLNQLTCKQDLVEVARIIHVLHDEVKDKDFELELAWICEESKGVFEMVPNHLKENAEKQAKALLESDMDD